MGVIKMDAAAQTHHWMEELLQGAWETQGVPMEPAVSLEQLKIGRSYGKMLLKSRLMKLEKKKKMAEQSNVRRRMAKLRM